MALNPSIILQGSNPNLMAAYDGGQVAGARSNQIQQQNALTQQYRTDGAGILAGNPESLNALAQIDAPLAQDFRAKQQGLQNDQETLNLQRQNTQLRVSELSRGLAQDQRTAAQAEYERAAGMLSQAETPEQFQMIVGREGFADAAAQLGLTPEMLTFENRNLLIASALGAKDGLAMGAGGGSAKDQEIQRTMQAWGVDYATAQGIADGVLKVSQDPTTREIMVTNLATRETFAPSISQGQPEPPAQAAAPVQQQPAQSESTDAPTFGDAFKGAGNSFGFQGVARNIANTAADATGFKVPFPEDQQTGQDFAVLGESLVNDFASAYGRQPPSWLLQNIAALVPQAGRPFEGPQRAQTKLTSIARDMISRREAAQKQLSRRLTPAERQEALALIAGIDATLARVNSALQGFKGGGDDADDALMQKYLGGN